MSRKLGRRIRSARLATGESLRGFARAINISAPYQCDIEHGRRRPSDTVLHRIASRLGLTVWELKELRGHGR